MCGILFKSKVNKEVISKLIELQKQVQSEIAIDSKIVSKEEEKELTVEEPLLANLNIDI